MSQHHLTVKTISGSIRKLVAGWDWPLQQFFLTLAYPGEEPFYDSQATMAGIRGFRNIGDVEQAIENEKIPFSDEHEKQRQQYRPDLPAIFNPKLLPLLCELLNEKDGPRPTNGDHKLKFWDNEPDPVPAEDDWGLDITAEWDRQYIYPYSPSDPHPIYTLDNYTKWLAELRDVTETCPYKVWICLNLVDLARQRQLAND